MRESATGFLPSLAAAIKAYLSAGGRIVTPDDVQRGGAGTVWPDQSHKFAFFRRQVDAAGARRPPKFLVSLVISSCDAITVLSWKPGSRVPKMPFGANRRTRMATAPRTPAATLQVHRSHSNSCSQHASQRGMNDICKSGHGKDIAHLLHRHHRRRNQLNEMGIEPASQPAKAVPEVRRPELSTASCARQSSPRRLPSRG